MVSVVTNIVRQGDLKPWVSHSTKANPGQMVVEEGGQIW